METKTVKIGERQYEIQRFRGLKAILVMAALTRVTKEVPDILNDVSKAYSARNTVVITEPMSRLPRWEGFTKEDFDEAEKSSGRREIEIPAPIGGNEQMLQALPMLLEQARKEVVRLLAILITPNSDLKEADKNDTVEALLDKHYDELMYDADLEELAELLLVGQDVLMDQLSSKKDRLGKLIGSLWNRLGTRTEQSTGLSLPSVTTTEDKPAELTPSTSTPDVPTSSTPSPAPTDGTETLSYTGSPGES